MANYPLEYGSHTDPDSADESKIPDSSPATQRYPREWGAHLDEPEDDAPVAPVFTPVMPTLLGGAHPDTFPLGVSPPSSMSTDLTAVSWPGTDVASGIPATDEALRQNRTRLAQAALPIVQSSRGPAQGTRGIAPPTEPAPGSGESED